MLCDSKLESAIMCGESTLLVCGKVDGLLSVVSICENGGSAQAYSV